MGIYRRDRWHMSRIASRDPAENMLTLNSKLIRGSLSFPSWKYCKTLAQNDHKRLAMCSTCFVLEASSCFHQIHRPASLAIHILSQSSGLSFRLKQTQDVVFAHWTFNVTNDGTSLIVHKLDTDLSHTAARAGSAQHTGNLDELDGNLRRIHLDRGFLCSYWIWTGAC